ncbi:hypothetical protein HFO50_11205 [Rhizobium leguminosarum]|uniref:hypothetical protein n=1 Tax=Rhizobium leguminosarum TaxID=384 RepID=UPI001C95C60C|nr:hypothetical protein [Rhizobium leguminosarum]MBY5601737.1 hypothetical protein [Rhizobium leguminosarum]
MRRLISHLQNGDDNDDVEFVSGTAADIVDMHLDASVKHSTYSIRHWIISPLEATTRPQMREVLAMMAVEFGFDAARAVIVEHKKRRATEDAYGAHWHVLLGEIDPVSGKVLRCSFDRIIHELVARWSEFRFGHKLIQGKHTKSVIAGLKKRGAVDAASKIETELGSKETPSAEAFTNSQHQEKKRAGIHLPAVRQAIKSAVATAKTKPELEAILSGSSLLVTMGDKEATWIVTDPGGNLIGSLARLAGQRKSEINKIMERATSEPVDNNTNNRTSDPLRGPSNSQPAGTKRRSSDNRPRNAHPDTAQNPGEPRAGSEPDRATEPETGLPEAPNRDAIVWLKRLGRYQDQLSDLLGKANMLAMHPEERIVASLWVMEERALADLKRTIPVLEYSERTERLRVDAKDLDKSFAKKRGQLFDAELSLRNAKRPNWWHYLFGIAFIFERRHRHLELAVQQAFTELEKCERELEMVKSKLLRNEFQEKQQHVALVQDITERRRAAGSALEQVEAANDLIRLHPALAFCGLNFLLAHSLKKLDEKKRLKAQIDTSLNNEGLGYWR